MNPPSEMALSHLKLRHLMLIELLVTHGTLHKAARLLNISQPAATSMLSDLEALLGTRLFLRDRRGVTPTAVTQQLLDKTRPLLAGFEDLIESVQRLAGGRSISLRVGVIPQAFSALLPGAVDHFCADAAYSLQTHEGTSVQLIGALIRGELDCVVGRLPAEGLPEGVPAQSLRVAPLYRDEVCMVARVGHPVLRIRRPTLAQLAGEHWVLQRRDSSVRRAFTEAFHRVGIVPPDPLVETHTYVQNLAIVAGSDLLTVAPRRAAEQYRRSGHIQPIALTLGVAPSQVSLISRETGQENSLIERFAHALQISISASALLADTDEPRARPVSGRPPARRRPSSA
ncbi:MAG: hypothetical protein RL322_1545 [Pseudomonadota bacterium]